MNPCSGLTAPVERFYVSERLRPPDYAVFVARFTSEVAMPLVLLGVLVESAVEIALADPIPLG